MGDSIADCGEALEIDPTLPDGYYHRALAYQALGKNDQAIADYEEFITLSKDNTLIQNAEQQINLLTAPTTTTTTP
jgi:Tfp pilus assembly protein PilF